MTDAEMRGALDLGPEWTLIWAEAQRGETVQHLCSGMYGPDHTYFIEYVDLPFQPIGRPGLEVAFCARCREAWVRAVTG